MEVLTITRVRLAVPSRAVCRMVNWMFSSPTTQEPVQKVRAHQGTLPGQQETEAVVQLPFQGKAGPQLRGGEL